MIIEEDPHNTLRRFEAHKDDINRANNALKLSSLFEFVIQYYFQQAL